MSVLIDEDAISGVVSSLVVRGRARREVRKPRFVELVFVYDVDDSALVSPIQRLPSAKTDRSQRAVKRCLVDVAKGNLPYVS